MNRSLMLATTFFLAATAQAAFADMVSKQSPHSVSVTIDRLQAAVEQAGATVFARIDHAKGAAAINTPLRSTEVLLFGNPQLGTPAMLDAQTAGLDLPMRVLAYEDANGNVMVTYHTPDTLAADHGLPEDAEYLKKMTGALGNLTNAAIAAE